MSKRMRTPCDAGFVCPYWDFSEDGESLCTAPEVTERGGIEGKKGRYNLYPLVLTLEMCPLVNVDTPIEKWLKSLDKEEKNA